MILGRKKRLAVDLVESIRLLCDQRGLVLLNFTGDHITITGSTFDSHMLESAQLDATKLSDLYKERLQVIKSLSETLREVLV